MSPTQMPMTRNVEICCAVAVAVGFISVFLIGVSGLEPNTKFIAAAAVSILFAVIPVAALLNRSRKSEDPATGSNSFVFDAKIDEEFATLEEAAVFFSASLKSDEMFRLLKTRIEALLPSCHVVFYAADGKGGLIRSPHLKDTNKSLSDESSVLTDLAYRSFSSRKKVRPAELQRMSDSDQSEYMMVAVPLFRGDEAFCVLAAYCSEDAELPDANVLDAIAVRVAPLIAGSMSFESSVANALTDSLTQLPNERAMYLLLESQVAEAQRFGKSRSLTLLAIDIDAFDRFNSKYGHSEGDRVLTFAGRLLLGQLRKMDLLSRTSDDEFFVILPTTDRAASEKVVERITEAFGKNPYKHSDGAESTIVLNFGFAVFGTEGETADKLIRAAVENKQIEKHAKSGSVLKFPTSDQG